MLLTTNSVYMGYNYGMYMIYETEHKQGHKL